MFTLTHTLYAVDTYTAQATVGDVNKGLTNHKVGFPYTLSVKSRSFIYSELGVVRHCASSIWKWRWGRRALGKDVGKREASLPLHINHTNSLLAS